MAGVGRNRPAAPPFGVVQPGRSTMSSRLPPVPPANRSDKGPGSAPGTSKDAAGPNRHVPDNLALQDRQGNIKQNTTHQGYQQDR
jgi:hypothetical protein